MSLNFLLQTTSVVGGDVDAELCVFLQVLLSGQVRLYSPTLIIDHVKKMLHMSPM